MSKWQAPKAHRAWEDWVVIALGMIVALAPWIAKETGSQAVVINAAAAGLILMMLGELDLVSFRRWVVLGQLACAVWVVVSPLVLGYATSGSLRLWHWVAGLLAVAMAAFELWQHEQQKRATESPARVKPGR